MRIMTFDVVATFNTFISQQIAPGSEPLATLVDHGSGKGYALQCARDVKEGELLFRIPAGLLLRAPPLNPSDASSEKSPALLPTFALSPASDDDNATFSDLRLILELLYQRSLGSESIWFPYISLLPPSFPTCPLFWSEDDVERRLRGSPLWGLVSEVKEQVKQAWEWAWDLLHREFFTESATDLQKSCYDWDLFLWAYTVIQSRAFKVTFPNSAELETVLVPFGDIANHAIRKSDALVKNMNAVDVTTNCLEVISGRAATKDTELTIHYNDLAPWQTLLHYGFSVNPLIDPNPFDRINLTLEFPEEDDFELESKKMLLFGTIDGVEEEQSLGFEDGQPVGGEEFLASVRVALATDDELLLPASEVSEKAFEACGLGKENEMRAVETISGMLSALDSLYPNALEEDMEKLKELEGKEVEGEVLADREALRYVVGQRLLLARIKEWAEGLLAA